MVKIFIFLISLDLFGQNLFFNKCMDKFPAAGPYMKSHQLTRLCNGCGSEQNFNEPFLCISRRIRERGENEAVAAQKCVEKLKGNPSCNKLSAY